MPVTLPPALTNSKPAGNLSVMFTLVAFEGPLLVTLIVKLTKSFTWTRPLTLAVLTIVKLTTGSAVMFMAEALLSSGFNSLSLLFTLTTLEIVPFNLAFTQIVKVANFRTLRSPIVHKPVSGLYVVPADAA